jgi:hypothetical protein
MVAGPLANLHAAKSGSVRSAQKTKLVQHCNKNCARSYSLKVIQSSAAQTFRALRRYLAGSRAQR